MPAQSKANNLNLEDKPTELSNLNALEEQLISISILHEDGDAPLWQTASNSWTCSECTN